MPDFRGYSSMLEPPTTNPWFGNGGDSSSGMDPQIARLNGGSAAQQGALKEWQQPAATPSAPNTMPPLQAAPPEQQPAAMPPAGAGMNVLDLIRSNGNPLGGVYGQPGAFGNPAAPTAPPVTGTPNFSPQYFQPGGYNPLQYASDETTAMLAKMLGSGISQTNPVGQIGPPPQNLLTFGNGSAGSGGENLNAGLVANSLEKSLGLYNDPNVAIDQFNQQRAAELARAGTSANPIGIADVMNFAPPAPTTTPAFSPTTPTPGGDPMTNVIKPPPATPQNPVLPNNPAVTPVQTTPPTTTPTTPVGGRPPGTTTTPGLEPPVTTPPVTTAPVTTNPPATPPPGTQTPTPGNQQTGYAPFDLNALLSSLMGGPPPASSFSAPDSFLADQTNDLGYLRGVAQNAGYATDATPAWEAMVAAQQRNTDRNAANLAEQFNMGGNRFSSVFGNAMTDFYNQNTKDQNASLTQAVLASQEAARGRELSAANSLGQMGTAGASQLSSQGFQSQLQQQSQERQAALQAALAASGGADSAAQALAGYGNSAGNQLLNNAMNASNSVYGQENQAATNQFNASNASTMAMYNAQQALLPLLMGYDQSLRGLGQNAATGLNGMINQNAQTGSALGQQQFGMDAFNIDRQFQEYLRTQPEYSPLLPYIMSLATNQPTMYQPQYRQPELLGYLNAAAGIMQGAGSMGAKV